MFAINYQDSKIKTGNEFSDSRLHDRNNIFPISDINRSAGHQVVLEQ
jgi:hypothetical protein